MIILIAMMEQHTSLDEPRPIERNFPPLRVALTPFAIAAAAPLASKQTSTPLRRGRRRTRDERVEHSSACAKQTSGTNL